MTRVFFVNRFYAPDHSATSQILTDLCVHLAAEGREIHVITSRMRYDDPAAVLPSRETLAGVKVDRTWTSRFGRASVPGRLADYLAFYGSAAIALWSSIRRGDIVVAKTDPPLISVLAAAVCRLRGARLINWLKDLYPEVASSMGMTFFDTAPGGVFRILRNRSLEAATINVAISEGMANRIRAQGLPERQVVVIPDWTDDASIQPLAPKTARLRTEWGFAESDFVVCYSGNLGQAHEVETVLEAARRLRTVTDVRFLFIGGGFHTQALARRAEAESLTSFAFQPYQPRERLTESLSVGDAHLVSLKPDFEGLIFPSKLYGIAAAARPILATVSLEGESAALVRDNYCGVAVSPGDGQGLADAILSMRADPEATTRMGENARTMLERKFTRALSLSKWSALLDQLPTPPGR